MADLLSAYRSGKFCDITIQCGERKWKAHSVIIGTKSQSLASACETALQNRSAIDLSAEDETAVNAMIEWCYKDKHGVPPYSTSHHTALVFYLKVYGLAKKYHVVELEKTAREEFVRTAGVCWKDDCFAEIVELFFNRPEQEQEDGLRKEILSIIKAHAHELLASERQCKKTQEAIQKNPSLLMEVARAAAQTANRALGNDVTIAPARPRGDDDYMAEHDFRCPACGEKFRAAMRYNELYTHDCPEGSSGSGRTNTCYPSQWVTYFLSRRSISPPHSPYED